MEYVLKPKTVQSILFNDTDNNVYSIATLDKGGPIINGADVNETKKTFEAAFKLASAVTNLLFFKLVSENQKLSPKPTNTSRNWDKTGEKRFLYHEMTV